MRRIGILTGGGDVPGLNSVIKSVVYRAAETGDKVVGIRRGWEGLTHVNLDDPESRSRYILDLDPRNTRTIDRTGGTYLHSSRTNPAKMKKLPDNLKSQYPGEGPWDVTPAVQKNISSLRLDYLIAIGGDDTLSYAAKLDKAGMKVVAIPKTMDNDVWGTEYCIGFSTAITRATEAIERQRTTVGSHERIGIFRIFGRDAGFTALYTAFVASLRCAIPEHEFDVEKMIELLVKDKKDNPSNYSLVVLSEGAKWHGYEIKSKGEADAFGHKKKANVGEDFADEVKKLTDEETIVSDLTYDLRSGSPDFLDKMVAIAFAAMAFDCVEQGKSGLMMGIKEGCYAAVPIPDPKLGHRAVDVARMYNTDRYRPNYASKLGLPVFMVRA